MKKLLTFWSCILVLILIPQGDGPDADEIQQIEQQRAWSHIRRVLLHAEYGRQTGQVQRWVLSPRWIVVGGTAEDHAFIEAVVAEINTEIADSKVQLIRTDTVGLANIGIIFRPADTFAEIAQMNGFSYREGGVGYAGVVMTRRGNLAGALVLVADELSGQERRATIIQELIHAIGPVNDSPHFPESVLFELGGAGSSATGLSAIDRQLIRFLYRHLTPGDDEKIVLKRFEEFWPPMP